MSTTAPPSFVLTCDASSQGSLSVTCQAGDGGRWTVLVQAGDQGFDGSCALSLNLPWSTGAAPWFLLPGFFYGQGRDDPRLHYPRLGQDPADPWCAPSWDFALDRAAAPLLLAHREGRWYGLDWDPHYHLLGADDPQPCSDDPEPQIGCGLAWDSAHGGCLRLNLPANEHPRRHARNRHDSATERRLHLPPGASLRFSVALHDCPGDGHGYHELLRGVYQRLHPEHPPAPLPSTVTLLDCAVHGLLAWHWVDDPGYWVYTAAYDRSAEFNANNKGVSLGWHFESLGFVGGFPVAFGLLWAAAQDLSPEGGRARQVAERCLERWCREGQSDWGFFRTSYHPGAARTRNGSLANPAPVGPRNDDPSGQTPFYGSCWQGHQERIHARTTADASYYLARCLALLGPDHPHYETWLGCLRRSLEAALSVQDASGRFGQLYDLAARRVHQQEGAGGLLWIPAMAAALPLVADDPDLDRRLRQALALAGAGYAADIEAEWICGAPEDVSLAPTSEDGYNAILAYAALHRLDGDPRWLALWQRAADWTLTWRKCYNVRFMPGNLLACGDFRCTGGDFASANNNHMHVYGCNCLAELHRLTQLTGDAYYGQRAADHWAFCAQLLSTVPGRWNGQRGMMSEQFYTNDWSIWGDWDPGPDHVQKGSLMGFSHVWCINMILLGLEQMAQLAPAQGA